MTTRAAFTRSEPDARRRSLIAACITVLARTGIAGVSVRSVAVEAGVSPGLVGHYFAGIDALVAAAYAEIGAQVEAAHDAALAAAGPDPRARLVAYVTASFAPPIADPQLLATWVAFWSLVRSRPDIARQHDGQYAAYRAGLERLLADCRVVADALHDSAIALTALIDGLWLELCLSPKVLGADRARRIAVQMIDRITASDRAGSTGNR